MTTTGESRDNWRFISEIRMNLELPECKETLARNDSLFYKITAEVERVMYDEMRPMFYLACVTCKRKVME